MARAALLSLMALVGCARHPAIATLSASESAVQLSYRTGTSETAVQSRAEAICATYGKHARQALAPVVTTDDWSTASFYCLPRP